MPQAIPASVHALLTQGTVLPAHPLALNAQRTLDERRQRALSRYYLAAGAGGLAIGVHTTQFGIHDPQCGLYEPVLALGAEEMDRAEARDGDLKIRVAGICGPTQQAVREATLARELGYHLGLVNLGSAESPDPAALIEHCRTIAEQITLFGFYLQPAVGGVELPFRFWQEFCDIENVAAIKVAAFDRYHTIDVVRAVATSGRADIALYTGNDDAIVTDLITPFSFRVGQEWVTRRFVGGLLGQWAVWTRKAVDLLRRCQLCHATGAERAQLVELAPHVTDANAALFDAHHNFRGCLPGIHEILRRQGLLEGTYCLEHGEVLSPGQSTEIDRILADYPHLTDDDFVAQHRDEWLR